VAYSTLEDLQAAVETALLVQLTDDAGAGSVDATKVARAVADADAVVDAHLRAHYSVPLASPIPAIVRMLSVDLALHQLYERRAAHFGMPEHIRDKRKDALALLSKIRSGDVDLGVEPPPTASTAEAATYQAEDQVFTATTMEDF
jgi:phage gp36-like protein